MIGGCSKSDDLRRSEAMDVAALRWRLHTKVKRNGGSLSSEVSSLAS